MGHRLNTQLQEIGLIRDLILLPISLVIINIFALGEAIVSSPFLV